MCLVLSCLVSSCLLCGLSSFYLLLFCHSFLCLRLSFLFQLPPPVVVVVVVQEVVVAVAPPLYIKIQKCEALVNLFLCHVVLCCLDVLYCTVFLVLCYLGLVLSLATCKAVSPFIFNWIVIIHILQDITLRLAPYITVKFTC